MPDLKQSTHLSLPVKSKLELKRESVHYVNNKEFSQGVVDYVTSVKKAKANSTEIPRITEYIGRCFLRIAEGLSHKPNFIRYTYREEMVMDGVENCIKAIMNFRIDAATRTGLPNAFSYFTQICYFAFLRRIMKEKKQQDIKFRYIEFAGIEDFMTNPDGGAMDLGSLKLDGIENGFINVLKKRIVRVKKIDKAVKDFKKTIKIKSKTKLELFVP
jgi:hypothetical protein